MKTCEVNYNNVFLLQTHDVHCCGKPLCVSYFTTKTLLHLLFSVIASK